jgi:hypothetical protein
MFSRPRFAECEDKTRQGNGMQEYTVAVTLSCFGYGLADDQRQTKLLEPDAEVIFWSILPQQPGHGIALDKHRKLPGHFSEDENKYNCVHDQIWRVLTHDMQAHW